MKANHIYMALGAIVIIGGIWYFTKDKKTVTAPIKEIVTPTENTASEFLGRTVKDEVVKPVSGSPISKKRFVGNITNNPQNCGSGTHLVNLQGGGYGCVMNS